MPVNKIKDYKIIDGQKVKKTKEEYNRETCNGKKIWYFQLYYDTPTGERKKYKSGKYSTKEEAIKEEAKFKLNTNNVTIDNNLTIYDLYNSFFFLDKTDSITNKESSLYTKEYRIRKYVLPFFFNEKNNKYDSISKINIENLKKWKQWLNDNKELRLSSKKGIFNTFSSLIMYGIEKYGIEYNPLKLIGNFKARNDQVVEKEKVRFLTKEDYNIFINEVDDDFKIIFHFLYEVGCRKGELQALTWEDIDFKKSKIRINKTLSNKNINGGIKITNTKNKKIRYVDISKKLHNELIELYDKMKCLDGFNNNWNVFGGLKYISSTTLARKKDETYKRLKEKNIYITEITIHEFRHSSASYMISNNIPIEIIAYRLGDTVDTIREVYAHLFPDTQKDVKGLFNNL